MANDYPRIWFDTFLSPETAAPVDLEMAFIGEHLPVSEYPKLLDVPCGIGRHAGPLARLGYDVVGVDLSPEALTVARSQHPDVDFREMDMAALDDLPTDFDGVLCLWQSFGYEGAVENARVLDGMAERLRPGGRLLLDVYNADAVALQPPESTEERGGRTIRTKRTLSNGRLYVEIEYDGADEIDAHEWQVYTPREMREVAESVGLEVLLTCAWFDASMPAREEHVRMQLLMERNGAVG